MQWIISRQYTTHFSITSMAVRPHQSKKICANELYTLFHTTAVHFYVWCQNFRRTRTSCFFRCFSEACLSDLRKNTISRTWFGDSQGVFHTLVGHRCAPLMPHAAMRSLAHSPGTARCPVSVMYHKKVVLMSCWQRGYVTAAET